MNPKSIFLLLIQTQKWCSTLHLQVPCWKHWLSSGSLPPHATSLFYRCNFRAVLLFLTLNRQFILCIFPFILQPLWKMENSLLWSHEDSWQIQCKGITSPRLAVEAKRSQPRCNLPPNEFNPHICFLPPYLFSPPSKKYEHYQSCPMKDNQPLGMLVCSTVHCGDQPPANSTAHAALLPAQRSTWLSHDHPCSHVGHRKRQNSLRIAGPYLLWPKPKQR